MKSFTACLLSLAMTMTSSAFSADAKSVHDFQMKSLEGKQVDLAEYKGKVLLIVNTASRCGLTPQYEQLQMMHEEYKDQGLVILGFPCNQFGGQEPEDAKGIRQFCTANYGVKFPMFAKIEVNGDSQAPLYDFLKNQAPIADSGGSDGDSKNDIRWNFEKFVVGKDGKVAARFSPRAKPNAPEVMRVVAEELAE